MLDDSHIGPDDAAVLEQEVALPIVDTANDHNLEGRTKAHDVLRVAKNLVEMGITRESDDEIFHLRVMRTHVLYGQYFEAENSLGNLHKLKNLTLDDGKVLLPTQQRRRDQW